MRLHDIALTSQQVAATAARNAKIDLLAGLLARCPPALVDDLVGILAGTPRQRRLNIGHATLRGARAVSPATAPTLTLAELDDALDRLAAISGAGAAAERGRVLHELFARATADEQDFIVRLLLGELRQGALEGLMVEAVAKAAALRRIPERT